MPTTDILQFETPEQLKEFLTTNEQGKLFFSELLSKDYIEKSHINGLETNKNKLLEEKKELQKKYKELEASYVELEKKLDGVDEEEYTRLKLLEQKWIESTKAKTDNKSEKNTAEIDLLTAQFHNTEKKLNGERDQLQKLVTEKDTIILGLNNSINNFKIDQSLVDQMDAAQIEEIHRPLLLDAFRGRASIEVDDMDVRQVVMLDKISNIKLPIKDWFTGWIGEETNKTYIKAPNNNGGGSGTSGKFFNGVDIGVLQKQYLDAQAAGQTSLAVSLGKQLEAHHKRLNGITN